MTLFDLPGPGFLKVWLLGGACVAVVTLVLRMLLARPRGGEVAEVAAVLEPPDVAYLARGHEHAIEAAVTGLVHRGVLVVEAGELRIGQVSRVREHGAYRGTIDDAPLSDVEAHIVDRVRDGVRSVAALGDGGEVIEAILRARVERHDLLAASAGGAWLLRAPGFAWLAVGGIKMMIGMARARPIGGLVALLMIGAWVVWKLRPPRLTGLGQKVLWHLRRRSYGLEATATTAPAQLEGHELALAYALFGGVVASAAIGLMMPSVERELARASLGGTTSGGCSSGCGGGGCGGGGCGGRS